MYVYLDTHFVCICIFIYVNIYVQIYGSGASRPPRGAHPKGPGLVKFDQWKALERSKTTKLPVILWKMVV